MKSPSFNKKKKTLIVQEPGRSQNELKKTIGSCQHQMTEILELSDKAFKAAIIECFNYEHTSTNEKK